MTMGGGQVNGAEIVSVISAMVAAGAAVFSAWNNRSSLSDARSARKDASAAKALATEIEHATRWHETEAGREIVQLVRSHERILADVASRHDMAELAQKVGRMEGALGNALAGIGRLEGYFLEEGVKRR